jgi:hypothetical protein
MLLKKRKKGRIQIQYLYRRSTGKIYIPEKDDFYLILPDRN